MNIDERSIFGCHGGGATQNVYIKNLIIQGAPGSYDVKLEQTLFQKIKAALGLGPNHKQMEAWVRQVMLGEPKERKEEP